MRHAQRLIDRILFLEGLPTLAQPLHVQVGHDLKDLFSPRQDILIVSQPVLSHEFLGNQVD
jgi:bacterioferritin (cytochrome b1)